MPRATDSRTGTMMPVGIESFQSLANIYLDSAQRLVELNFSTVHDAVETATAVTKSLARSDIGAKLEKHEVAVMQPMLEKSIDYSRNAYEILSKAQLDTAKVMTSQIASLGDNLNFPADWNAPFDIFSKGLQEFSALAQKTASATTGAARTAVSELSSKSSRAA